jgi:hypothetical protein
MLDEMGGRVDGQILERTSKTARGEAGRVLDSRIFP